MKRARAPNLTTTPLADLLAEENQKAVATLCKWSGAEREALESALPDDCVGAGA